MFAFKPNLVQIYALFYFFSRMPNYLNVNMITCLGLWWFCDYAKKIKGAVLQAIQVLKPYKCDKNIMWVYARLR